MNNLASSQESISNKLKITRRLELFGIFLECSSITGSKEKLMLE
jgi:hypothetical protein